MKSRYNEFNFDNEIIGGSKDISAGQFIDRVGVKMGLHFPAGKALEQLALKTEKGEKLPIAVDGVFVVVAGKAVFHVVYRLLDGLLRSGGQVGKVLILRVVVLVGDVFVVVHLP